MIFQHPTESLNPVLTIRQQFSRVLKAHNKNITKKEIENETISALESVQIPDPASRLDDYPVEYSGGMNQRVMIALALSLDPDLLIADEPTTALDLTIGAHILELLDSLSREKDLSIIYITHNMGIVANHCDRAIILYAGRVVEEGETNDIFDDPKHPYTEDLLDCIPMIDDDVQDELETIEGSMPLPIDLPDACYYADRCQLADDECWRSRPHLEEKGKKSHKAACVHSDKL
jgi:oligopeptide/dipeptide ABC transporter ATP-binding protein